MPTELSGLWYDVAWTVGAVAALVLLIAALGRWGRLKPAGLYGLVQFALILLLPIVGPAAYLWGTSSAVGKPARPRRSSEASTLLDA